MIGGSAAIVALVMSVVIPTKTTAQTCGFPWTVSTSLAGGSSVAVSICGLYTGCQPHNPHFTVNGSAIDITLQTSEPPNGCQCIAVEGTFQQTVLVQPVPPGSYTVTVTLLSCSAPEIVGSTELTQEASSAIPALDSRGLSALLALLAIAGMSLARR